MKKWHISDSGEVVVCKAFLRRCPKRDYDTWAEAMEDLTTRVKNQNKERGRMELQKLVKSLPADSSFFSSTNRSFHDMGERVEEFIAVNGINKLQYANFYNRIGGKNFYNKQSGLSLVRRCSPDYAQGRMKVEWTLEDNSDKKLAVMDLSGDFENSVKLVHPILVEYARKNAEDGVSEQEAVDSMRREMQKIYAGVTEKLYGPSGYERGMMDQNITGFFGKTLGNEIEVRTSYNSLFDYRDVERYLDGPNVNRKHKVSLDMSVIDNEDGASASSWELQHDKDGWSIITRPKRGEVEVKRVQPGDDAAIVYHVEEFVKNNMLTNNSRVAKEKGEWVRNTINGVDEAMSSYIRKNFPSEAGSIQRAETTTHVVPDFSSLPPAPEEKPHGIRKPKHSPTPKRSNDPVFSRREGDNNGSARDSLLDLFS